MVLFGIAMVFFPLKTRAVGKNAPAGKHAGSASGSASISASASGEAMSPPAAAMASQSVMPSASVEEKPTLPTGKGLPLDVDVAVFFVELKSFDDTKGEFECTTDVRLTWYDLRLAYGAKETYRGYKEWRAKDAEDQLAKIWQPNVDITNKLDQGPYVGHRLRIYPDGRVETITRTSAKYSVKVDAERFPFDRQSLVLDFIVREDTTDEVVLRFSNEDVQWSRVAKTAQLDGWKPALVELDADTLHGWNGERYATLTATIFADRLATTGLAPIFIPLVASLLIRCSRSG
jgi:hypothetical protein